MRKALSVFALMTMALAALLGGCKDKGGDNSAGPAVATDIKIGVYLSLSGGNADFGITTKNGIDLAVEQINASGGINGKKIAIIAKDTRSTPDEARTVAQQLVSEKVHAVIGSVESGQSIAAAPTFQDAGIPMVSPSSTNPQVTTLGDMIFRVCYLDDFQGAACAAYAQKELKAKTAAIIYCQDDAYSKGLAQYFKARFEKSGGKVAVEATYREKESDFSSAVSNVKGAATAADVVFVPVYYNDASLIAKECRKQGINVPLLGGDGWESPQLLKLAGTALEGCYFGYHYDPSDQDPKVQGYIKAYREKFKDDPNSLSALGYDAVYVIKNAIEKSGEEPAKIAEGLRQTKAFHGVTGTFDIDEKRNARKPISILRIEADKLKQVAVIKPQDMD